MTTKIALIGARLAMNFGGPSLLVSTTIVLNTVFSDAVYTLLVPAASYESDRVIAPRYGVKVTPFYIKKWTPLSALFRRCTGVLVGPVAVKETIRVLAEADVIIDIWGIIFADSIGSNMFSNRMFEGFRFVLGKILGKPVIKYTADLGPFNKKWNRIFARLYLGRFVDLILARSETSCQCVKLLGVNRPIIVVPDAAFLLPSVESKQSERYAKFSKERPLIGVSVSYQAQNRASDPEKYLSIMADFINYLIVEYGAHVLVIPNELSGNAKDDTRIAEQICVKVSNNGCEVVYVDNLLAQEIKGVINQCEVIVASRYHTIVAALSLGIPTLGIGWHHKYVGVLGLVGQEHRLCNIEKLEFEDLVEKFEDLWKNRKEIRKRIARLLPDTKEQIAAGAREVHNIALAKSKRRVSEFMSQNFD